MASWKYDHNTGLWSTIIKVAGMPVHLVATTFEELWYLIKDMLGRSPL